jgi:hypothetical protein
MKPETLTARSKRLAYGQTLKSRISTKCFIFPPAKVLSREVVKV